MYPPLFQWVSANAAAKAVLGASPVRFWPFGKAPQSETRPYAVHQLAYGAPENTLSCTPACDTLGVQIDAYALDVTQARAVASVLRDTLQPHGYITAWNGEFFEQDTKLYRVSFTFEVILER